MQEIKILTERERYISNTKSLCPECLKIIDAVIFERENKVWIRKFCSEHGEFEDLYWGDYELYLKAKRFAHDGDGIYNPNVNYKRITCPFSCGLCKEHLSHPALINIVVTNRCNLSCWYCFFYSERAGYIYEPSLEQIKFMLEAGKRIKPVAPNAVQLTGGEPTLRDDILEIIRIAKEVGYEHVQLNTNGIRLALEEDFAIKVRRAGVNTVYLSFDGVSKRTNPKNLPEIPKIIQNCRKADLGIVLVPTVINNVNDHEVWKIIEYASKNIDVVRGVNFQPVSLVGRMPKEERMKYRITIPDVIKRIEEQSGGIVSKEDFYPVPYASCITHIVEALTGKRFYELTNHFACGMATYLYVENGKIIPITRFIDVEGLYEYFNEISQEIISGRKNKYIAILQILFKLNSFVDKKYKPESFNIRKLLFNIVVKHNYEALGEFHKKLLFIGMMHFMDLYNYDIERVKRCNILYALPDGRFIPFCAFNVIPELYRDKVQKEYSISIEEWEKRTGRKLSQDFYRRIEKC